MPRKPKQSAAATKPKRGRPWPADYERGRKVTLYLSAAEVATALRHGATVQDGVRAALAAAVAVDRR